VFGPYADPERPRRTADDVMMDVPVFPPIQATAEAAAITIASLAGQAVEPETLLKRRWTHVVVGGGSAGGRSGGEHAFGLAVAVRRTVRLGVPVDRAGFSRARVVPVSRSRSTAGLRGSRPPR
jgi:hypothetical protein